MAAYPTELPLFELRSVLSIIQSGEIGAQKSEFAKNLWWIQGYAQKMILGEGQSLQSAAPVSVTDAQAAEAIQKAIDSAESTEACAQGLNSIWLWILTYAAEKLIAYLQK